MAPLLLAETSKRRSSSFSERSSATSPSRRVSFSEESSAVCYVEEDCVARGGLTKKEHDDNKASARAHRIRYPNLPKFCYMDDDAMASAANKAAAIARVEAETRQTEPHLSDPVVIIPGRKRSFSDPRAECTLLQPTATENGVAAAVAAATARVSADWHASPCAQDELAEPKDPASAPPPPALRKSLSRLSSFRIQRYDSVHDAISRFAARNQH